MNNLFKKVLGLILIASAGIDECIASLWLSYCQKTGYSTLAFVVMGALLICGVSAIHSGCYLLFGPKQKKPVKPMISV